jgi:hypothetical protein
VIDYIPIGGIQRPEEKKMKEISYDGDTWFVLGVGTVREGKTFVHLASTTRSFCQRNGTYPVQINDWIPSELLK